MQQVSDEQNIVQGSPTQSVAPDQPVRPATPVTESSPARSSLQLEDNSSCLRRYACTKVSRKLYDQNTGTYVSS